ECGQKSIIELLNTKFAFTRIDKPTVPWSTTPELLAAANGAGERKNELSKWFDTAAIMHRSIMFAGSMQFSLLIDALGTARYNLTIHLYKNIGSMCLILQKYVP
ncbi:hypothetical protein ACJX0J_030705, partial [Zea mays]